MRFEFIRREHPSSGSYGWLPKKQQYIFEPGDALTVAHDVFEHHFPKDYGQINFELQAVGAAFYVREEYRKGEDRYDICFSKIWYTIYDIIFSYYANFLGRSPVLDPVKKCKPLQDDEAEHEFALVVQHGLKEENCDYLLKEYSNTEDKERFHEILNRLKTDSIHWFRRGYTFAANRFKHGNRYELGWAFANLRDHVNDIYKYEEWGQEDGDRLYVDLNLKRPSVLDIKLVTVYEQERKRYAY